MAPTIVDRLRAPANFQLYELKKALSRAAIDDAFKLAMRAARGRGIGRAARLRRSLSGETYWASFIAFRVEQETPFLPGSGLIENTFGFVLLIELEHLGRRFLGVFTHETPSLADWLRPRVSAVSRVKFANALTGASTVRRLSVQRMTASSYELQAASYEASASALQPSHDCGEPQRDTVDSVRRANARQHRGDHRQRRACNSTGGASSSMISRAS